MQGKQPQDGNQRVAEGGHVRQSPCDGLATTKSKLGNTRPNKNTDTTQQHAGSHSRRWPSSNSRTTMHSKHLRNLLTATSQASTPCTIGTATETVSNIGREVGANLSSQITWEKSIWPSTWLSQLPYTYWPASQTHHMLEQVTCHTDQQTSNYTTYRQRKSSQKLHMTKTEESWLW